MLLTTTHNMNILLLIFTLYNLTHHLKVSSTDQNERKPYIVYMGEVPENGGASVQDHHNLLSAVIGNEEIAREARIYSYGKSFNGFVARLMPDEAKRLSEKENVVSVFANTRRQLHTTRSWDFLGLTEVARRRPYVESNIVVGLLDTGIYTNSPSFDDTGYGPVPSKWKGVCVTGVNFTGCNNKVIGARFYNLDTSDLTVEEATPVDTDGHGTHTSSTAAGTLVQDASLYGVGKGNARGGVPSARIAMYKVCWTGGGCSDMDILAAFNDAIADGVDLLSISIGGPTTRFFQDPIAIGSFHAMKKGILTSCSGGNDGPGLYTVQNVAPWIFTVAATSIDRKFKAKIKLGNGVKASGISINTYSAKRQMYSLTSGVRASNVTSETYRNASACDFGSLAKEKVNGKIVYCLGNNGQDTTIRHMDGAGIIITLNDDETTDIAFTTLIPGTYVVSKDGNKIDHYINTTQNPQAAITKSRAVNITAPFVASFSSRGPQLVSPNILKPDISAPGLDILAAYSKLTSITGSQNDNRYSLFNILSGTSMACPHAAAAAAYVKSFHPEWSPAAIKSAIMTTATPMKIEDEGAELGSGSGQINPLQAMHPGLVYNISLTSYLQYLCKEGYNSTTIGLLVGSNNKKYNCSGLKSAAEGTDGLNYPSMHVQIKGSDTKISAVFYRTVTYVGYGKTVYKANVTSPKGLFVKVSPDTLKFTESLQELSFKVVVNGGVMNDGTNILSALLEWADLKNSVRSPIVVFKSLGYV